ncbi:MAG: hypothetical protein ACFCD0_13595 [Gemmataceae bacterium]
MSSKPVRTNLSLETLEDRAVPALIAVTYNVETGTDAQFIISGDDQDNEVTVQTDVAENGDYFVLVSSDTDFVFNTNTGELDTILAFKIPAGATPEMLIQMSKGEDSVTVSPLLPGTDGDLPGDLTINGQGQDDTILVENTDVGGTLTITGNGGSDDVTVIGGSDNGVEGDVDIKTNGGNDTVTLTDLEVDGDLDVDASKGNDDVSLVGVDVGGDTSIDTGAKNGSDNDDVTISDSTFDGDLTVDTAVNDGNDDGPDTDTVTIGSTFVGGDVHIKTGEKNDTVDISDTEIYGSLTINTTSGNGDQADTVVLTNVDLSDPPGNNPPMVGGLTITTGNGDDIVDISDFTMDTGAAEITTGNDDDTVVLDQFVVNTARFGKMGQTKVNTGNGDDFVDVDDSRFTGDARFITGSGDDDLNVEASYFAKKLIANVKSSNLGDIVTLIDNVIDDLLKVLAQGDGNEFVDLFGNTVGGEALIKTGDGSDYVRLGTFGSPSTGNTFLQGITVDMGTNDGGNDFIEYFFNDFVGPGFAFGVVDGGDFGGFNTGGGLSIEFDLPGGE